MPGLGPVGTGFASPKGEGFASPKGEGFASPKGVGFASPKGEGFASPKGEGFDVDGSPPMEGGLYAPVEAPTVVGFAKEGVNLLGPEVLEPLEAEAPEEKGAHGLLVLGLGLGPGFMVRGLASPTAEIVGLKTDGGCCCTFSCSLLYAASLSLSSFLCLSSSSSSLLLCSASIARRFLSFSSRQC